MAKKNSKEKLTTAGGIITNNPEKWGITDAPYATSEVVVLPKAVEESLARPDSLVDEANDAINHDYPWAVPSMTSSQRAILCELYRIRKALEAK